MKGQGAGHEPEGRRNLKFDGRTAGGSSGPGREGVPGASPGVGVGVARDCWPEPSSQPGLSAWGGRKGLAREPLLSFWHCHHHSRSSVGGETESHRA